MRHRYPFEALHWLRQQRVDLKAKVVGESARLSAEARRQEANAELARRRVESSIAELSVAELERLKEGQQRAADLQVAGDWRKGAEAKLRATAELEAKAREASLSQAANELKARRDLGNASNQASVVDAHRSSFRAARAAAAERAEEEALQEQWRPPLRRS